MNQPHPVFIGGAWPYANGPLHLGHIAALLPGDVLARYFRQNGHRVLYVSGSDCHGTPIALRAEAEGRTPQDVAERYHREFAETFRQLGFTFDLYSHTTADAHASRVQDVFRQLRTNGWLREDETDQAYCPNEHRFLPDRYVKGTCPRCSAAGSRGDQCDACGAVLSPIDLKDPRCRTCGTVPQWR